MEGSRAPVRIAGRAVSARGALPDYLGRRTALELVVFDVLIASAAVIGAFPPSVQLRLGSVVAVTAVLPGVTLLVRAATLAAGTPEGLCLDQFDPHSIPGVEEQLEEARHLTAGALGLLLLGSVAAAAALIVL